MNYCDVKESMAEHLGVSLDKCYYVESTGIYGVKLDGQKEIACQAKTPVLGIAALKIALEDRNAA